MLFDKTGSHRTDYYKHHGLGQWDSSFLLFDPYRDAWEYDSSDYLDIGVLRIHSYKIDERVDTQTHKVYKFFHKMFHNTFHKTIRKMAYKTVHRTSHKLVHTRLTDEEEHSLVTPRCD